MSLYYIVNNYSNLEFENRELSNKIKTLQKECEISQIKNEVRFNDEISEDEELLEDLSFDNNNETYQTNIDRLTQNNALLSKDLDKLITYINDIFKIKTQYTTVEDLLSEASRTAALVNTTIEDRNRTIEELKSKITQIESTTEEKGARLQQIIETINNRASTELDDINTEIAMYSSNNNEFSSNPLDIKDFIQLNSYDVMSKVNKSFEPFLRYVSKNINSYQDSFTEDFNENHSDDFDNSLNYNVTYHSYMILMISLLGVYSKEYIRNYLEKVYKECESKENSTNSYVSVPKLVLTQTSQINSIYYLMNRYNSKCYQPDQVNDFGDFLFNCLAPEFRPDTTEALNLFQPNIGKRYNSILIYTRETMKILSTLRDKLEEIVKV